MTDRPAPLVIPEGTSYPDAIRAVLQRRLPDVHFRCTHPPAATRYTPHLVYGQFNEQTDPWADVQDLANAIGMQLRQRGTRVTAYVPWQQRMSMTWWRISAPLRRARVRRAARRNPTPQWWSEDPRPDYDDD